MTEIEAAGYIVHDNDDTIHGYGATADVAWDDMLRTMAMANIAVIGADEDSTEQSGSWTRESGFTIRPATAALLSLVESAGGSCTWGKVGRIGCTVEALDNA